MWRTKHLLSGITITLSFNLLSCTALDLATQQDTLSSSPTLLQTEPLVREGGFGSKGKNQAEPLVNSYLVSVSKQENLENISKNLEHIGAKVKKKFAFIQVMEVELPEPAILTQLKNMSEVVHVTPNYMISITQLEAEGKGKGNPKPSPTPEPSQIVPAGIQRIGATPGSLSYTGNGVGIAIVDTGIDRSHQDLSVSTSCHSSLGTFCEDDHGHGTHVAGIAAALNNTIDVVGVAPNATLYAVKVLDNKGDGSDSSVIAGLEWISQNSATVTPPIKVINMSLGRPLGSDENIENSPFRRAIQSLYNQGITVVVAAGNEPGREVSQNVPATYPEVLAVASTAAQSGSECKGFQIAADTASYFSTDGKFDTSTGIGVTISAPGEKSEQVVRGCKFVSSEGILSTQNGGGLTRMSGTSMATPHVAGVIALMYEKASGNLNPETVRSTLRNGADRKGTAPLDSPTTSYTFDGEREGVLFAPSVL